jgi:hypothetical protein
LKELNQQTQTEEEKQEAFFQTLRQFYQYAAVNSETDEAYGIQEKPFSLVVTERFFQGVGALVTIPAIFANYFSINAQRGESLGLEDYEIHFQDSKMRELEPWAGALPLGFLAGIKGVASGGEVGYRLWNRWTGHDPNLYQENLQVWEQTYPGIRAFADTAAYLISSFLIFPVAGLATQQLHAIGTPIEFQRAFMFWTIFHWGLTTTLSYAEACQEIVSKVGGWFGGDPIGRVREDLLRFVVNSQETFYKLERARLNYLAETLEQASKETCQEEGLGLFEETSEPMDETNVDDDIEFLHVHHPREEDSQNSASSHHSTPPRQTAPPGAPMMDSLTEPLLAQQQPELEETLLSDDPMEAYLLADDAADITARPASKGWWARTRQWLLGQDVPPSLQSVVQRIYASE